jgi:hypothetical protein
MGQGPLKMSRAIIIIVLLLQLQNWRAPYNMYHIEHSLYNYIRNSEVKGSQGI